MVVQRHQEVVIDSSTVGQCVFEGVEGRLTTTRGWPFRIVFDVNVSSETGWGEVKRGIGPDTPESLWHDMMANSV